MTEDRKVARKGGIRAHAKLGERGTRIEGDEPLREKHIERNGPCPCGSGNKYKRCCAGKEDSFFTVLRRWLRI